MSIEIDDRGRARVRSRVVRGPIAAIGLVLIIAVLAVVAWQIHLGNLRGRDLARRAAEEAEAREAAEPPAPGRP